MSQDELRETLSILSDHIVPSPRGRRSIGLNHGLHLTGGEPFLHYDRLLDATRLAREYEIPSLFVETNSFWAVDPETTRQKLIELSEAGLDGIMVSVNPFYAEYVPFENTKRAVKFGREVYGDDAIVYQESYLQEFERAGLEGTLDLSDYVKGREGKLLRGAEFFLSGRAPYEVPDYGVSGLETRPAEYWFDKSCPTSLLREWHDHVDNYGNYVPGYCGGLSFGKIEDLPRLMDEGLPAEEYPVLSLLIEDDMAGLYDLARGYGYRARDGYYSKCHLCTDLRTHLHEHGDFRELKPDQFYEQVKAE